MNNTELIVVKGKVIEQKKGFTADVGEDIGQEQGAKMIKNYVQQNSDDVLAHFTGRNIIEAILAQPGVVGIRTFYALNDLGIRQLVMVGVDEQGDNLLHYSTTNSNGELIQKKGIVADRLTACPPYCGSGTGEVGGGWYDFM